MPERDLYEVLGVARSASAEDLKAAFKKAAGKFHPDRNPGNKAAEEKFKEASAAFDVLGNAEKRKLYDEFGPDAAKIGFDPEKAKAYRAYADQTRRGTGGRAQGRGVPSDFGGFGVDSSGVPFDLGDIFGEMFGGGRGRRAPRGPQPGEDLEAHLRITLNEAVLGGERRLAVEKPERCKACKGTGLVKGAACGVCSGSGLVASKSTLVVTIPKGAASGTVIRLAGQGGAGPRGGSPGDVLLKIEVEPHPLVRVEGLDLLFDLPLTIGEALHGGEVRVPTFEGDVKLSVPAGSSSGRKLRLRGKGLPNLKHGHRGDLFAVVQIVVPQGGGHAAKELGELAAQIDKLYTHDVRAQLRL